MLELMVGCLAALSVIAAIRALPLSDAAAARLPRPTRELEWKDVNFLSLSDTHGWLLGHQHATWPEPNYSGDYGDFASFVTHMRDMADAKGVDLLLVDAGDHHDGSGLVSSSEQSAAQADEIFAKLPYDILTVGNHELYSYTSARWIYDNKDRWSGRYLTSNVNITVEQNGRAISTPLGDRFAKFTTNSGKSVTALGIIFDFQAHGRNITIQSSPLLAREQWFLSAIEDAPDMFVLAGHMPVRGEPAEWGPVFDAIRRRHPRVPVFLFGGHTHVRDCVQYDSHSIGVVPGRYMETVAFTSASLSHHTVPVDLARRYIDANRRSYMYHSGTTVYDFDTKLGTEITASLLQLASSLNISQPLGTAPNDFYLGRNAYGHPRNVLTEWSEHVMPMTVKDQERKGKNVIISMGGSQRFDLFQGGFNRNDELTVSPFVNSFRYVSLPMGMAKNVTEEMLQRGASKLVPSQPSTPWALQQRVDNIYGLWLAEQWVHRAQSGHEDVHHQEYFGVEEEIKVRTLGYVTNDACRGRGDDIEHVPVPWSALSQPDFIWSPFPTGDDDEAIDVVVMDFALDDFFAAANSVDPANPLQMEDTKPYAEGLTINTMWGIYAGIRWQP